MPPLFDVAQADRWFAVTLNNLAWDLVEQSDRAPAETEQMIHAAHASCWHWQQVGNVLNEQRSLCLLACAHASGGRPDQALHYSALCAELSESSGASQTGFDRAAVLACASRAHAAAGNQKQACAHRGAALKEAEQLDEDEKRVIQTTCGPVVTSTSP